MPAEWEPHEGTWLSWPHKKESWPGAFEEIPGIFVELVRVLSETEKVRINVADGDAADSVRYLLKQAGVDPGPVSFHTNPTNDAWCRDHGPIYIVREHEGQRQRAMTDWKYNAWGNKYPPFDLDDRVPVKIAEEFGETRFVIDMVLEGGSIDVNGTGSLLTTESCLLNPNRNPRLTRSQIEQNLRDNLGVTNILWLGDGIVGDDTDGHIDDLTRFVSRDTVVTVLEDDPQDENYALLQENRRRLESMSNEAGEPLKIVDLPMPDPVIYDGQRLPASYANFYIANRRVLVPIFGCDKDTTALETLQRVFPDRLVLGINCRALVWGLGAIHCVTQQQPAV
jgi:agmatine deiminase